MQQRNFRNYKVWQDAISLVSDIYSITKTFPKHETFGLTNQMNRAAVSIPSNIAEGSAKPTDIDFARFLDIALGSCYELETQIVISNNLGYIQDGKYNEITEKIISIQKQLTAFSGAIRKNKTER